ncbi:MAG TPA: hypothetical protein VN696_08370 [Pyrinomonadaceae bacterium]|nr:hypothetical protein [Pyrinomonadaceae bacterium]
MKRLVLSAIFVCCLGVVASAQPTEPRVALDQPALAADSHGAQAIEARLSTQVLNGAEDSPVMNVKLAVKNVSGTFYNYVSGWATFYDSAGVRCGEGLFKLDALAVDETAATDTPGLRLRCSPATWRIVATNLLTRTADVAKPGETAAPSEKTPPSETEGAARTTNFVISIDGEEHPIQLNRPVVLQMGNRERKIVLRSAP